LQVNPFPDPTVSARHRRTEDRDVAADNLSMTVLPKGAITSSILTAAYHGARPFAEEIPNAADP
jgi:hypothetical protein